MTNTYNAAKDPYAGRSLAVDSYARDAAAITKSDTADNYFKAIYVGGTGDVVVLPMNAATDADVVTFSAVPVGTILPIQVRKVMAATTATLLVGLKA